ncbi:WcbI family polysaccharide biosynthesis putative acetyltransferase [uncultured Serinicoccus sp.]|uniref:WcbI family polysaccharide biosynthesis putative acetyltransferase n=1 Tax=uncultured Serinicoccus sp. TaxID=735514 RepID=UPI0026257F4B|nr:WcbI family polysaccharide biosynthesis putative acetyltransferase [uncultured Serinicoccus sp.]
MSEDGRRRHYGGFYGLEELPATGRPRLAVFGNCQAEALRVALDTADVLDTVRMPPVHELEEADLAHLDRLLAWVDVLVAQSVADDYRGMPLGTDQVATRLRPGARVVAAPNYFFTGLYPEQVLVRHPDVEDPPVVPYHDVRRLARAAGWDGPWEAPATLVRELAADSLAELERRERAQESLRISDVVRTAGAAAGRTVDHPGNEVLLALARRVLEDVLPGSGAAVQDPGRVLLASVATPLSRGVLEALDLRGEPREGWLVDGEAVSDDEVGDAHDEFYARHPRVVEVGVQKKEDLLRRWGWRP